MKGKPGYVFRVPNNEEGDLFRSLAKKFLNTKTYVFKRRGQDGKPIHKVCMHRYYLHYKPPNGSKDRILLTADNYEFLSKRSAENLRIAIAARKDLTRKVVKELMRVCSDDEDFLSDVAEKLERLYVAKTLLGEE